MHACMHGWSHHCPARGAPPWQGSGAAPRGRRWFTRYSGWAPGQLEAEVAQGVWFCAAAGPALVLQPHSGPAGQGLWHTTMELMGGEHAELAAAIRDTATYRPDVMGHGKFHPRAEEARRKAEEQEQQQQQQQEKQKQDGDSQKDSPES